jgi:hypothetical protein
VNLRAQLPTVHRPLSTVFAPDAVQPQAGEVGVPDGAAVRALPAPTVAEVASTRFHAATSCRVIRGACIRDDGACRLDRRSNRP